MTALRPEYDTVRDQLAAALNESAMASTHRRASIIHESDDAARSREHALNAAKFHGAAYGHAFRAAELAYDLGAAQGASRRSPPTEPPTPEAEPALDASPTRVPVNMAQALRRARATTTLSQKRLAEQVGLDPSYLSMAEGGKRVPKIEALILIAEALNMNLSTLIALGEGPATS